MKHNMERMDDMQYVQFGELCHAEPRQDATWVDEVEFDI